MRHSIGKFAFLVCLSGVCIQTPAAGYLLDEQIIQTQKKGCKIYYLTEKNIHGWHIETDREECGPDGFLSGYHNITVYNAFSKPVEKIYGYFSNGYWTGDALLTGISFKRFSEDFGIQKATFNIYTDTDNNISYIGQMTSKKTPGGNYPAFKVCSPFRVLGVLSNPEELKNSHLLHTVFQTVERESRKFCPAEKEVQLFLSDSENPAEEDVFMYVKMDLKTHRHKIVRSKAPEKRKTPESPYDLPYENPQPAQLQTSSETVGFDIALQPNAVQYAPVVSPNGTLQYAPIAPQPTAMQYAPVISPTGVLQYAPVAPQPSALQYAPPVVQQYAPAMVQSGTMQYAPAQETVVREAPAQTVATAPEQQAPAPVVNKPAEEKQASVQKEEPTSTEKEPQVPKSNSDEADTTQSDSIWAESSEAMDEVFTEPMKNRSKESDVFKMPEPQKAYRATQAKPYKQSAIKNGMVDVSAHKMPLQNVLLIAGTLKMPVIAKTTITAAPTDNGHTAENGNITLADGQFLREGTYTLTGIFTVKSGKKAKPLLEVIKTQPCKTNYCGDEE